MGIPMSTLSGMDVNISLAAERLGVSVGTVRRRIHDGTLIGRMEKTPQGFKWLVTVPDPEIPGKDDHQDEPRVGRTNGNDLVVEILQDQVRRLSEQLDASTKEISELHQIIGARALNPGRSWWKLWRR